MSEAIGRVADSTGNWVDRLAPAWTRPYLRLARLDRPIGSWLLLIPCWWSSALAAIAAHDRAPDLAHLNLAHLALFFAGAFAMRGAGCTWNDIVDRDLDREVERTRSRPIPSGQVSVTAAAVFLGGADGLGGGFRPARCARLPALRRLNRMGDRLRYHLRPPGPGG